MDKTSDLFEAHAQLCGTLSNPRRLMIIAVLSKGEASVGEIADSVGLPSSTVSQHLAILRSHHLVNTKKDGKSVYYSLADSRLPKACSIIRNILLDGMKQRGEVAREIREEDLLGFATGRK